jgi:hypothetical protein
MPVSGEEQPGQEQTDDQGGSRTGDQEPPPGRNGPESLVELLERLPPGPLFLIEILVPEDHRLGVQPDLLGIGAKEALHQHAGGETLGVPILDRLEHSRADPGLPGDLLQGDSPVQALGAKVFAKTFHVHPYGYRRCNILGKGIASRR